MAEAESTTDKFCREQDFFLVNRRQLFKGWPHVKQKVIAGYYLFDNGDRRDKPVNDFGQLLCSMIPAERQRGYWQERREVIAAKLPEDATEKQIQEKLERQIYATLLGYYQGGPHEVRIRMEWLEQDRRDGVRYSNALSPRKLSELRKVRNAGLRSDRQVQIAGSKALEEIPGIGKVTATKIIVAVGDKKPRGPKPKQLVLLL